MPHSRELWIALNAELSVPREVVYRLAEHRDDWSVGDLAKASLSRQLGIPQRELSRVREVVPIAPQCAANFERIARDGDIEILTIADPDYPAALGRLVMPPPVLYLRGRLPPGPGIAIVGSRAADTYGREVAELFAADLARRGLTIVSGLARGIDATAHQAALAAGGRTVGVLGCGMDLDYPRGHRALKERMTTSGGIVSEFPLGTAPLPRNFPIRNRIIVALSLGTLIIQGEPRSGTLVTARLAVEQNRDVWAVPGRIFDSRAAGPNALIRDGAMPALRPRDIVESLPLAVRDTLEDDEAPEPPPGLAGRLLGALPHGEAWSAERFNRELDVPVQRILEALLGLELDSRLRRDPGGAYRHAG